MISKDKIYAVVGASANAEKYGHRVFKDLLEAGFKVFPINPNADSILSQKTYDSIGDLPEKPDVVICVVPPEVTEKIVREAHEADVRTIWMQPGSESTSAISLCEKYGIECVHDVCIMVERRKA